MYKCLSGDAEPSLTRILNFTIYTTRVNTWIIAQPSNFDKSIKHLINSIKFGILCYRVNTASQLMRESYDQSTKNIV